MGQAYQLETSTDRYLLEDGSGVYLLEVQDVTLALTGLQINSGHGRIRADWPILSAAGQPVVSAAVPLVGEASATAQGSVGVEAESPDRNAALSGLESATDTGLLLIAVDVPSTGSASTGTLGLLAADGAVSLTGHLVTGESGTVSILSPDSTEALTGLAMVASAGLLTAEGGTVDDGAILLAMQRRRHFGRSSNPLVRQPSPRKVR